MKLWSLGQQRCITTYKNHEAGVWALCVDESFTSFYSAGNDCKVFYTDMKQSQGVLFCTEKHPILKVVMQIFFIYKLMKLLATLIISK